MFRIGQIQLAAKTRRINLAKKGEKMNHILDMYGVYIIQRVEENKTDWFRIENDECYC